MITVKEFNSIATEDEFDNWFRDILINKKEVSGDCWFEIYCADFLNEVDKIVEHENEGRWSVPVSIIFKFEEKYYSIWYNRGLTECQDNEWPDQIAIPVKEVEVKHYEWVEDK